MSKATKIMIPILSIGIWPLIKFIAKRIRRRRMDREAREDRNGFVDRRYGG